MLYTYIVEDKGLDRPWLLNAPKSCDSCTTDKCCNTTICLNDNGNAKSFENVCFHEFFQKFLTFQKINKKSTLHIFMLCIFQPFKKSTKNQQKIKIFQNFKISQNFPKYPKNFPKISQKFPKNF
jgi:hypothetical protein